jgi:hypothetical protein
VRLRAAAGGVDRGEGRAVEAGAERAAPGAPAERDAVAARAGRALQPGGDSRLAPLREAVDPDRYGCRVVERELEGGAPLCAAGGLGLPDARGHRPLDREAPVGDGQAGEGSAGS